MTITEMVYIRNEISHAASVLQWLKSEEGYKYGSKKLNEEAIKKWEAILDFWKNELN